MIDCFCLVSYYINIKNCQPQNITMSSQVNEQLYILPLVIVNYIINLDNAIIFGVIYSWVFVVVIDIIKGVESMVRMILRKL